MIVLIDNYDSFSFNLYQMIGALNPGIAVFRNDRVTADDIEAMKPGHIVISPGPGRPAAAGISEEVIRRFAERVPILGVCLGHQAICEVFGATVSYAKELVHGKASEIRLDTACPIFRGLPETIRGGRYHSLAVLEDTLPGILSVTARTGDGEIMGVRLAGRGVYGLQFHPESILTPEGKKILSNFFS